MFSFLLLSTVTSTPGVISFALKHLKCDRPTHVDVDGMEAELVSVQAYQDRRQNWSFNYPPEEVGGFYYVPAPDGKTH